MVKLAAILFSSDVGTEARGGTVSLMWQKVFSRVHHETRGILVSNGVFSTFLC